MPKPALGRGLGALLAGNSYSNPSASSSTSGAVVAGSPAAASTEAREQVQRVPIARIQPCAFQPRKEFEPTALQELADSIREQGIIQPLIVRPKGDQFELIAGERRWRASQLAGLREVPVLVRHADDRTVLELALIENLQRENLNPMEEALGYARLVNEFQLRQEDVALQVGKSRTVVANSLRLLKLDPEVQSFVRDARISVGHAKVILGLTALADQRLAAERVIKGAFNVRQTEDLVARWEKPSVAGGTSGVRTAATDRDANVASLENKIRERFGTKVHLRYRQGKGSVEIRFFSEDELDRILAIIGVSVD